MKLVISRKGFDSAAGGAPSPIVGDRLISLPIPADERSTDTYASLGLGELVERQTRGRIGRGSLCHADPAFQDGRCVFGQTGAAQSHLDNQGVGVGSVFLFFGLFENPASGRREHWLFGYLRVGEIIRLGPVPTADQSPAWLHQTHPHTLGGWNPNNTLYVGKGCTAARADEGLRLTAPEGPLSRWRVPAWLHECGLSYHGRKDRWRPAGYLDAVHRGQEFVCDVSASAPAQSWVEGIINKMRRT